MKKFWKPWKVFMYGVFVYLPEEYENSWLRTYDFLRIQPFGEEAIDELLKLHKEKVLKIEGFKCDGLLLNGNRGYKGLISYPDGREVGMKVKDYSESIYTKISNAENLSVEEFIMLQPILSKYSPKYLYYITFKIVDIKQLILTDLLGDYLEDFYNDNLSIGNSNQPFNANKQLWTMKYLFNIKFYDYGYKPTVKEKDFEFHISDAKKVVF